MGERRLGAFAGIGISLFFALTAVLGLGYHELSSFEKIRYFFVDRSALAVAEGVFDLLDASFSNSLEGITRDIDATKAILKSTLELDEVPAPEVLRGEVDAAISACASDVALINPSLVITETTYAPEKGLDLSVFPDAVMSFEELSSRGGGVRTDFPILESTGESIRAYLIGKMKNNRGFIQIGLKSETLSELKRVVNKVSGDRLGITRCVEGFMVIMDGSGTASEVVAPLFKTNVNPDPVISQRLVRTIESGKPLVFVESGVSDCFLAGKLNCLFPGDEERRHFVWRVSIDTTELGRISRHVKLMTGFSAGLVSLVMIFALFDFRRLRSRLLSCHRSMLASEPVEEKSVFSRNDEVRDIAEAYNEHLIRERVASAESIKLSEISAAEAVTLNEEKLRRRESEAVADLRRAAGKIIAPGLGIGGFPTLFESLTKFMAAMDWLGLNGEWFAGVKILKAANEEKWILYRGAAPGCRPDETGAPIPDLAGKAILSRKIEMMGPGEGRASNAVNPMDGAADLTLLKSEAMVWALPLLFGTDISGFIMMRSSLQEGFGPLQTKALEDMGPILGGIIAWHAEEIEKDSLKSRLSALQKFDVLGKMAGGIAHDLNNLLTPILGFCEIILRSGETFGERNLSRIEKVRDSAERAAALTSQLLTFTKDRPGRFELMDLNSLVTRISGVFGTIAGETYSLELDILQGLPLIRADANKLEQVLLNLLVNARDAMEGSGVIRVGTRLLDERFDPTRANESSVEQGAVSARQVCFFVTDGGRGIDPSLADEIFEPFFTTKDSDQGSGIGLFISNGIVKDHGGAIVVTSVPGKGSTFEVRLPESVDSPETLVELEKNEVVSFESLGKVMVVEDNDEVRELIIQMLKERGFETLEAASLGEAGMKSFAPLDGIVCDVVLPDGFGPEFLRALPSGAGDPWVVLMSGYTHRKVDWEEMRNLGYSFLAKPFVEYDFLNAISRALAGRGRIREIKGDGSPLT